MLVSEELSAGKHTYQWNAATMSSGVYFYRLQAETYSETKQLMLLKYNHLHEVVQNVKLVSFEVS